MPDLHVTFRDLLHAVNLRHGTNGFTSLSKEGVLRIFFALKNPTASAGFEPANLCTESQHATSRPPKPLAMYVCYDVLRFFQSRCPYIGDGCDLETGPGSRIQVLWDATPCRLAYCRRFEYVQGGRLHDIAFQEAMQYSRWTV